MGLERITPEYVHIFQCMLERTDAIMNEVLEPVAFVLAYPTVLQFYSVSNVPPMLRINILCTYRRKYVLSVMDCVVNL